MFEGIDGIGWLVIGCAAALGFGLVKFMLVEAEQRRAARRRDATEPPAPPAGEKP